MGTRVSKIKEIFHKNKCSIWYEPTHFLLSFPLKSWMIQSIKSYSSKSTRV